MVRFDVCVVGAGIAIKMSNKVGHPSFDEANKAPWPSRAFIFVVCCSGFDRVANPPGLTV